MLARLQENGEYVEKSKRNRERTERITESNKEEEKEYWVPDKQRSGG